MQNERASSAHSLGKGRTILGDYSLNYAAPHTLRWLTGPRGKP